ncbi:hypothetical protein VNO77_06559 [Canavalia gladiata]|uniref:NB-ARC domain-containing protein n=1 Tax=Canavalia gladiata TaxID=3824 RepID=A0AAN9MAG7_CANGL
MLNQSESCILLEQGKESNHVGTSEIVLWIVVIIGLVVSVILDCALVYYEEKIEWIERKRKSLEALIDDYDQLAGKRDKVESWARRFWDSEDLSGIYLQLSQAEIEWITLARKLEKEAKECVTNYNKQSRGLLYGLTTAIPRLMPIIDVIRQIRVVRTKMMDHFKKEGKDAKNIYKSMERLRSQIRTLLELDQHTVEGDDKSVSAQNQKKKKSSINIDEWMKNKKDLFSSMEERWSIYLLLPLHAFVKDLSQLQLETEIEKLWKTDAEGLILAAEVCIRNSARWVPGFSILKNNIPKVTPRFREDMKCIIDEFDSLLERKDKYKFSFIDRASVESNPLSIVITDDTAFISAVRNIHNQLGNKNYNSNQVAEINSVVGDLEKMHRKLQKTEETAGRNACLEQLESIAQEIDKFLDRYLNGPELNRHEIRKAVDRLQKVVDVCSIKRQKSTKVVGLKNDVRDLVLKVTTSSDNPSNSTLSIVGMKGVGKTTLAKAIYYDKVVVEHFPVRVLVTVSKGAVHASQVLLMKRDGTKDQTLRVSEVCDHLKEKLCLIVLDNVLKKEDFDKLNEILLSGSGMINGSKIVLTTRFKNVALHADRSSTTPHQIRLLTKEESWELFDQVTNPEKTKLEPKVEKLARKVVARCGGLPLSISALGCVVRAKGMTQENLSWVLERVNHGHYKAQWLQVWEKNKPELNETMINCLYYFTLFPIDYEIPARRLTNLWVAEGLVKQNNQQTAEEIALRCLEELRDCNMIQVVSLKSNAKIKTCRLPCTLREIMLRDSDRTSRSQYLGTHLERRFAYRFDDHGLDANSANVFSKKGIPLSVFFFDKREGMKPGEHVGRILSTGIASEQLREIKVLDLERVFRPQLPKTLGKLTHITYLSLRWTYLEEFPSFISKLVNLETLDLKHTCIRVLPSSIWKLKKLRNLYLNHKYRSRLEGDLRGSFPENLHTLWGVFMYGTSPLLRDLHKLKNLKNLKIAFQLTETEKETLAGKIVQLNQLHSLRLRSVNEIGGPEKLTMYNMSRMENLSSFQLFGELEHKLRMSRLPQNLTDLTLSASKLLDDPMPELQNLPKLKSLCFYANSYIGKRMVCTTGTFLQLQVLRLWNLTELEEWDVKEGAMPNLMEFEVRSCINLPCPIGLKHLKALRIIRLNEISKSFRKEILKSKKTLLYDVEIDD